jgi:hypothetical protein
VNADDARDTGDAVEIRVEVPRSVADVFDGVSLAKRINRNQLVQQVLMDYADRKTHEHMVLGRLLASNPPASAASGKPADAAPRKAER